MAALPSPVTYGTVRGRFVTAVADTTADVDLDPDSTPVVGRVEFTPSVPSILVPGGGTPTTVLAAPISVDLDPDGAFEIRLVATDNPLAQPAGWTYTVTFAFDAVAYEGFSLNVPAGATVDLTLAAPAPSSPGTVTVVNEQTRLAAEAAAERAETAAAAAEAVDVAAEVAAYLAAHPPFLLLNPGDPMPGATPAGTVIVRETTVPPAPVLEVVTTSVTYAASEVAADGTTASLAVPAGTTTGDLLVAVLTHQNASSTWTPPAGWVQLQALDTASTDFRGTYIFALPVTGAAPAGPVVFQNGQQGRKAAAMFRVTGADLATPLLAGGAVGSRASNVYTVPALPGAAGGLVLSVTIGQAGAGVDPTPVTYSNGLQPFAEVESGSDLGVTRTFLAVAWQNTAAAFPSYTVTAAGAVTAMGAQALAIRADQ